MSTYQPRLMHAGVRVQNMEAMKAFYMSVCAFVVSDEALHERSGQYFCFLTGDPEKHHEFVLVKGPNDASQSAVFQFSFLLRTLDDLREAQTRAVAAGGTGIRPLNHGNAWSVYVNDPEGNTLEFYVNSPWYIPQPFGEHLDLSATDEEILEITEELCRKTDGFMVLPTWKEEITRRLGTL